MTNGVVLEVSLPSYMHSHDSKRIYCMVIPKEFYMLFGGICEKNFRPSSLRQTNRWEDEPIFSLK
jgi:hypothetical protein